MPKLANQKGVALETALQCSLGVRRVLPGGEGRAFPLKGTNPALVGLYPVGSGERLPRFLTWQHGPLYILGR